jgi:hypothetical protein
MLARIGHYLFLHMPRSGGVAWVQAVAPYTDEQTVILLGAHRHINVYDIEQMIAPLSAFPRKYVLIRHPYQITCSAINMLACLAENPDFWPAAEQNYPAMYKSMTLFNEAKKAKDYDELLRVLFTYFIPSEDGSIIKPMLGLYADEFTVLDYATYNQSFMLFMEREYGIKAPALPKRCNHYCHDLGREVIAMRPMQVYKYVERDLRNYVLHGAVADMIKRFQQQLSELPKYE